ncbi:MAG: hypothetical protein LBU67_05420 [Oscillospiraceae bacterium]|nr:hypothetical protein [Oscillospiraceae bacterium]
MQDVRGKVALVALLTMVLALLVLLGLLVSAGRRWVAPTRYRDASWAFGTRQVEERP